MTFFGDRHFEYDDAGNLVKEKRGKGGQLVTEYRYDAQNQLVGVHKPGHQIVYQYDALGRRIAKADAFGETAFLWNGDVLLSETRRHLHKLYVYEPDSFRPLAFVQNKRVYYYHLDHLGTPQELTDVEGQVVWNVRYRAYGNVVEKAVEQVENNLRFQGQYFDAETGLHYNRFRYYDPQTGQFVQQDPIGLVGGENVYLYVPSPTGWHDPWGLSEIPHGFKSFGQFKQFGEATQAGLTKAGFSNTQVFLQGSAVTGKSFETGKPFDVGRISDFDVALSNEDLLKKAKELGLAKGSRTGPIKVGSLEAKALGIDKTLQKLSRMSGREVNAMIFENVEEVKAKGLSVRVPTKCM